MSAPAFRNRLNVEGTKEDKAVRAMQANGAQPAGGPEYVFDNAGAIAESRYRQLSRLYDENTIRHIEQRGIEAGWSCLEIGGGGGSIASWLCARVGITGRVLATELDPRFLQELSYSNLEVRRHDIRTEGLPKEEFDLAHARLVLIHLPDRQMALRRLMDALKPGGWIVVEEFDAMTFLPNPAVNPGEANLRVRHAFHEALIARGVDLHCGRLLAHELDENGLVQVGVEATVSLWGGNSIGTDLMKLNFEEMRETMIRSGLITQTEYETDLKHINEQNFLMPSPMMWTAWGRKPPASARP
jgi:SAM-dependent methyltransferase